MYILALIILFFCQCATSCAGVSYCYVVDDAKHEYNRKLLHAIVEQELSALGPKKTAVDKAKYLSARISRIADKLLKKGFAADAYGIPPLEKNEAISFNYFGLWEGEAKSIPITFLVYVWPSEELALKYNAEDAYYASDIHSHPISCAFAVLDGVLHQKSYELVEKRTVRLANEEVFKKCEGSVDDLNKPFIHQMYSKGTGAKPSLSLHAYGLSTVEKVMQSFEENSVMHSYNRIHK